MSVRAIVLGLLVLGVATGSSQAKTYTCKFEKDNKVVGTCPIDTKNPNVTCIANYSNTLQGTCGGTMIGASDLIACAFHDPKIKASAAIESLIDRAKGTSNLATPAGFVSGSASIANPLQAFAIGYVEKSGAPQLNAGCGP
jgi:hypothetical protein